VKLGTDVHNPITVLNLSAKITFSMQSFTTQVERTNTQLNEEVIVCVSPSTPTLTFETDEGQQTVI